MIICGSLFDDDKKILPPFDGIQKQYLHGLEW